MVFLRRKTEEFAKSCENWTCEIRKNKNWTNSLQIACDNLNSQRNGTTKQTPVSVWRKGHEIINIDKGVVDLHKKRIIREIKKNTAEKFQVGDLVRV